tara:strand:+ start:240 stop:473 length:234 start_codon:yes stop_codon:yes gene_type:complete
MNNVKLASCAAGSAAADTVAYNERRHKLIVNNTSATAGTYTLGSSGNLAIGGSETIILEGYIGAAGTSTNVKLVELT